MKESTNLSQVQTFKRMETMTGYYRISPGTCETESESMLKTTQGSKCEQVLAESKILFTSNVQNKLPLINCRSCTEMYLKSNVLLDGGSYI